MSALSLGILALVAVSFVIAAVGTRVMIWLSPRIGFVDKPGGRKIHEKPKPLGGGVAITAALLLPLVAATSFILFAKPTSIEGRHLAPFVPTKVIDRLDLGSLSTDQWQTKSATAPDYSKIEAYWSGARGQAPLLLAFAGAILVLHLMGLIDDRRALGPYLKLFIQFAVTVALVIGFNLRAMTFLDTHVGGPWLSYLVTIFWIAAITNAFNFLDNMDGLSAGVAAICTLAFLITTVLIGQWFVAATLACLLGATLGFLVWNFPPAKIFMGDSGSLVIGFVLGVLTVRTTFLSPNQDFAAGWYAVFAPLIVLALPLYDLLVVSFIRISRGKSPFVGDKNHFSHRLVDRGMSRRTAVLCLYLVTAATSIAAIVLPHVRSGFVASLIVAQTLLILGVVMLLEQHPVKKTE
jgi:UDP-GlcNAc:undecaprenyl-phosphate/decaprenyl-phosphate GlcNAc-1-phosphate transferase